MMSGNLNLTLNVDVRTHPLGEDKSFAQFVRDALKWGIANPEIIKTYPRHKTSFRVSIPIVNNPDLVDCLKKFSEELGIKINPLAEICFQAYYESKNWLNRKELVLTDSFLSYTKYSVCKYEGLTLFIDDAYSNGDDNLLTIKGEVRGIISTNIAKIVDRRTRK